MNHKNYNPFTHPVHHSTPKNLNGEKNYLPLLLFYGGFLCSEKPIHDSAHWTTNLLPSYRSLNLRLFTHQIQGILTLLFQEEYLPSVTLRSWTYLKCAYRLLRMLGSRCWRRRWGSSKGGAETRRPDGYTPTSGPEEKPAHA